MKEVDKNRLYTHEEMLEFDRQRAKEAGPRPRPHFVFDGRYLITLPDGVYRIENGKIYPGDAPVYPTKGDK